MIGSNGSGRTMTYHYRLECNRLLIYLLQKRLTFGGLHSTQIQYHNILEWNIHKTFTFHIHIVRANNYPNKHTPTRKTIWFIQNNWANAKPLISLINAVIQKHKKTSLIICKFSLCRAALKSIDREKKRSKMGTTTSTPCKKGWIIVKMNVHVFNEFSYSMRRHGNITIQIPPEIKSAILYGWFESMP